MVRLASRQKTKKRNNEDNNFRRSMTSIPRKTRPCFKTRAVKTQSVKCDSRTAPSALSAGQLFWQRRFKFVQRAFSLREIALEPQRFTKFSGGFHWFTKPRQRLAQFQINPGISRVQIVNTRQNNGRSLVVRWPSKTKESSRYLGTTRKSVKQKLGCETTNDDDEGPTDQPSPPRPTLSLKARERPLQ